MNEFPQYESIFLNTSRKLCTQVMFQSVNLGWTVSRIQLQLYFLEYLKTIFESQLQGIG